MTPIATWPVGQSFVQLFCANNPKYPNRLTFLDERTGKSSSFECELYNRDYAINLTRIFYRTIGINLEREKAPHSSCFLPTLCMSLPEAPEIQVALFGRVYSTAANPVGEVKGLRWGVFNSLSQEEQVFEVNDAVAKVFIQDAPKVTYPHMEQVSKKGASIERPASDFYAMASYAERFRVVLNYDADKRIQSIILRQDQRESVVLELESWMQNSEAGGDKIEATRRILEAFDPNARELILNNLGLTLLPSEAINLLSNLNKLDLSSNYFKIFSAKNSTFLSLIELDLSSNNFLLSFSAKSDSFQSLKRLVLSNNHSLMIFSADSGSFPNLIELDLANTKSLKSFSAASDSFSSLIRLDLSKNDALKSFLAASNSFPALKRFDLSDNSLVSFSAERDSFPSLKGVYLGGKGIKQIFK